MASIGQGRPSTLKVKSSHGRRQPSESLYSMFEDSQVRQFKEAFAMIDVNSDGLISEEDLVSMLTNLGKPPSASHLASLLESASVQNGKRGINFTQFLTMMADHLLQLDPEAELREAFECFDDGDKGSISTSELRKWLSEVGDRMTSEEIDAFLSPPFADRRGNFDYDSLLKTLRIADAEEQEKRQ